jgi:hypothetical protein
VNPAPDSRGDSPALPGITDDESPPPATVYLAIGLPEDAMPGGLAEIQLALANAAQAMTRSGHPVRFLNGMYMPAQTRLLCVFAAESEEVVHATVNLLRLPFVQITITDHRDQGPAPADGEPGL